MSIKTFDSALDFTPSTPARATTVWSTIVTSIEAIGEGISLANDYKELTVRGMAPADAARKVFEKIGR